MRIGVQAWGSEGDVRPFIALARGLEAAGHSVVLSISEIEGRDYSSFVSDTSIRLRSTPGLDYSREELSAMGRDAVGHWSPLTQFRFVVKQLFGPMVEDVLEESRHLVSRSDLVIGHFVLHPLVAVAQKQGVPHIGVATTPSIFPTGKFPVPGLPSLGMTVNRFLWRLGSVFIDRYIMDDVNSVRQREGLAPSDRLMDEAVMSGLLNLVETSPTLFPRPPDWCDTYRLCGRFRSDGGTSEKLTPELTRFLSSGPPPIWMTFGSMMTFEPDADAVFSLLSEAARMAGCRAVIQCDRDDLSVPPEERSVLHVRRAPHSLVFPRCAAVVHHGGAGTCHSVTLSGCPSVVVMFGVDQVFWGPQLNRLGVAPKPILRRRLTAAKLAERLREVMSEPSFRITAGKLAGRMEEEDGVAAAVALIESAMGYPSGNVLA